MTARAWLTLALAERGEFQDGLGWGQEAILMAEALDHPFGLASACWALGYLHGAKGELDEAIALLKRAVSITREWNLALLSPVISWFLGLMYARVGRIDEGLALLYGVSKGYESAGIHQSPLLVHLGEACLLGARLDDAFAHADRALALTREHSQPAFEAGALRLLGEIVSRQNPLDVSTARAHFQQALAKAGDLDLRPLSAHCHLGLSTLYRRSDKPQEAQQHLTTALAMYRDLDMRFWLAKAGSGA